MGYRIAWIARRGRSTRELLRSKGLAPTGERDEFLDVGWYLLDLAGENDRWALLIADGTEYYTELAGADAEALSAGGLETLYFCSCDTMMKSAISGYRDGRWIWSVEYDCEEEEHFAFRGDPPQLVHELEKIVRDEQRVENETDAPADLLYSLPARIGEAITRFNHDPWPQPEEDPFEGMFQVLRPDR